MIRACEKMDRIANLDPWHPSKDLTYSEGIGSGRDDKVLINALMEMVLRFPARRAR
jgi:hypothetical protein